MAILPDARWVARDALGNAYSGAKLYVYNTGGLVLANLYGDAGLAAGSALTNPLTADANGVFPLFFVSGATFDAVTKTAGGVVLYAYNAVPGVGDSSGTIERDFATARLKISATGATVEIEARPATGDNIGGTWRLGGSDGTQADLGTIDSALTNVTGNLEVLGAFDVNQTKTLTEGGRRLTEILYTDVTAFNAVATVDIALPNNPAGTREWVIDFWDVLMGTTTTAFTGRLSYDNGATYKAGASDYTYQFFYNTGSGVGLVFDDANTFIGLSSSTLVKDANWLARLQMTITTPDSGSGVTTVVGRVSAKADSSGGTVFTPCNISFDGAGLGNYGRATHFRLMMNTGVVSGKYRVRSQRGTGE